MREILFPDMDLLRSKTTTISIVGLGGIRIGTQAPLALGLHSSSMLQSGKIGTLKWDLSPALPFLWKE